MAREAQVLVWLRWDSSTSALRNLVAAELAGQRHLARRLDDSAAAHKQRPEQLRSPDYRLHVLHDRYKPVVCEAAGGNEKSEPDYSRQKSCPVFR